MRFEDAEFGPLTFDSDIDAWVGTIPLTSFDHCRILWNLSPRGEIRRWDDDPESRPAGGLELAVSGDADGGGPSAIQRAAFRLLRAREKDIAAVVLRECAKVARESYVIADQLGPDAPALTTQRELAERLCSEAGVGDWLDRPRVDIHRGGEDELALVSFNFGAGFDAEHGIAVLTHGDRVVEVGGSSEFYDM